jgi:hypothetical protein
MAYGHVARQQPRNKETKPLLGSGLRETMEVLLEAVWSEAISRDRSSPVQFSSVECSAVQCSEASWLVNELARELQLSRCELVLLEAGR